MKVSKNSLVKIIPMILLVLVVGLSVGYSAYRNELSIQGAGFSVRKIARSLEITNVAAKNSIDGAISNYETYKAKSKIATISTKSIKSSSEVPNDTLLSVGFNLPNEDSKITYTVTIANYGSVELGLFDIAGFPDNLEYTVSNYDLQSKFCSSTCNLGMSKDIDITIGYKSYDESKTTYNLNLNLDFREFNNITYVNIENDGLQPYIINGGTLVLDFSSNPKENITVEGDCIVNSGYTYENYILTVPNVTSDIVISAS